MRRFGAVLLGIGCALAVVAAISIYFRPITFSPTVDLDETLPSVTLEDYTFHAETMRSAENPIVIAIHGGPGGDCRNLLPIAPLADAIQLVFYDQRMTGLSSRDFDGTLDLEIFFTGLDAIVDHFGQGRKVSLIGHSWGSMMASGCAGRHPEKVDKIILIEAVILRPGLAGPFFASQSGPDIGAYPGLAPIRLNSWRVDTSPHQHARDDFIITHAYPLMAGKGVHSKEESPEAFEGWRASLKTINHTAIAYANDPDLLARLDFISNVHCFTGKTLIVGSTCNMVYGSEHQERQMSFFQDARLENTGNARHLIFYVQPEFSLSIIRQFLTE